MAKLKPVRIEKIGNEKQEVFEHESFGKLSFCRTTSNQTNLFGSSVKHSNTVTLEILTASLTRSLGQNHTYGQKHLIRVELSHNQFASAIANMNTSGVPCTLRYVGGKRMEDVPDMGSEKEKARSDMEERGRAFVKRFEVEQAKLDELINKGKAGKGDLMAISRLLEFFKQELIQNQPFFAEQFERAMDKVVTEAKSEIEGFLMSTIYEKGLDVMRQEGGVFLGGRSTTDTAFIEIKE